MRFLITGDVFLEEVIGEAVTIDAIPGESFAVHQPHLSAYELDPLWVVTHVETGMRVGGGESAAAALAAARNNCAERTPEEIAQALASARQRRALANATKPMRPATKRNPNSVLG